MASSSAASTLSGTEPAAGSRGQKTDNAEKSWKEAAGRNSGSGGYQFGDLTRSVIKRTSDSLRTWSAAPKYEDGGYRFGDLFLKDLVANVVAERPPQKVAYDGTTSDGKEPEEFDDADESPEHRLIAAGMREQRRKGLELLENSVPRLEKRLAELEAKQAKEDLNAQETSEVFRLKVGSPLFPNPLEHYRRCLDDLKSSVAIRLDGCFVRIAEKTGDLSKIQQTLADSLKVAEQSSRCADEVCRDTAIEPVVSEPATGAAAASASEATS